MLVEHVKAEDEIRKEERTDAILFKQNRFLLQCAAAAKVVSDCFGLNDRRGSIPHTFESILHREETEGRNRHDLVIERFNSLKHNIFRVYIFRFK